MLVCKDSKARSTHHIIETMNDDLTYDENQQTSGLETKITLS